MWPGQTLRPPAPQATKEVAFGCRSPTVPFIPQMQSSASESVEGVTIKAVRSLRFCLLYELYILRYSDLKNGSFPKLPQALGFFLNHKKSTWILLLALTHCGKLTMH